jgi:hypothetical protein
MLIPLGYSSLTPSDDLIANHHKIKSRLKHKTQVQSNYRKQSHSNSQKTIKKRKDREPFNNPLPSPPQDARYKGGKQNEDEDEDEDEDEYKHVYNQEGQMLNKNDELTYSNISNVVDSMTADDSDYDDYEEKNNSIQYNTNAKIKNNKNKNKNKTIKCDNDNVEAMQSMNIYNQSQPRNYDDDDNILYNTKQLKNNLPKYPVTGSNDLVTKLNQLIVLLEEQQEEKTGHIMEELILYSFLGIFMIYLVDSFVKVGKYTR